MMSRILPVAIFSAVLLLIDWYTFQAVKMVTESLTPTTRRAIFILFWSFTLVSLGIIYSAVITNPWHWPQTLRVYLFAFVFVVYVSKLILIIFLLVDDILRLFRWLASLLTGTAKAASPVAGTATGITRFKFLSQAGLLVSGFLLFNLVYGMVKTAFNYQVRRVKLKLPNLPEAYNGLKIVQISDIHSGTFTRKDPLHEVVDLINKENADLVFFTGDLVNNLSSEAVPYVDIFGKIKAKMGVYSSLGNHDYGDYYHFNSTKEKEDNLQQLVDLHHQMGWKLLRNENVLLGEEGSQLAIIGMENWSALRNFSKYGDMKKAYAGAEKAAVKLLLSHDPTHWNAEVSKIYKDVDVTFAGHTHGFQFGIEIPGFRWSPAEYVYPQWAGLYQRDKQYLYVNRGIGFLLYPGRVGIPPEITVVELVKA